MLHIELRDTPYHGTTIEIQPDDESLIPGLRDMVECNFQIENPAATFVRIKKAGGFDGIPKKSVDREAEKLDYLSEAWIFDDDKTTGVPEANVMQVLTRLMELYIKARKELNEYIRDSIYSEDDCYDGFDDFDDDDDLF